jgi:hypothetical protein
MKQLWNDLKMSRLLKGIMRNGLIALFAAVSFYAVTGIGDYVSFSLAYYAGVVIELFAWWKYRNE